MTQTVGPTWPGKEWAPAIFVGMDAILSGLKQVHVEAGSALSLLACADLEGRAELTQTQRAAVVRTTCALLEEVVDGLAMFCAVMAALHGGGALAAGAARILISLNTWTPDKRKKISPFRALDAISGMSSATAGLQTIIGHGPATVVWHQAYGTSHRSGSPTQSGVEWLLRITGAELPLAYVYAAYARRAGFGRSRKVLVSNPSRRTRPVAIQPYFKVA